MKVIEEKIQETARQLLSDGEVGLVIGYAAGSENSKVIPAFVKRVEDVGQLIFNPLCASNLVKYLLDWKSLPNKTAVVVKGCDARAVIRLLQDKQIDREKIILLGVNCPGMLNFELVETKIPQKATLAEATVKNGSFNLQTSEGLHTFSLEEGLLEKCRQCESTRPIISDYLFGEQPLVLDDPAQQYADVLSLEDKSLKEKSDYWDECFSRCLRCYACRNACPACSCRDCVFDLAEPSWVAKTISLSDNTMYHLIRAFHVAGRCVDCGECERVCPVDIPLRVLNRKIIKDIKDLYGVPTPGSDPDIPPVLEYFSVDDPEKIN